jgi:hypothetical protein
MSEEPYKVVEALFKVMKKGFSKAVYWNKTDVNLRSHTLDKARFPKEVWQK